MPFSGHEDELKISVIDLHRAQLRRKVPLRWRDKDLTGLYFSSMDIGLKTRDYLRFMKVYFGCRLKDVFIKEAMLINKIEENAERVKERTLRKNL